MYIGALALTRESLLEFNRSTNARQFRGFIYMYVFFKLNLYYDTQILLVYKMVVAQSKLSSCKKTCVFYKYFKIKVASNSFIRLNYPIRPKRAHLYLSYQLTLVPLRSSRRSCEVKKAI